jgi:hypothetical protein
MRVTLYQEMDQLGFSEEDNVHTSQQEGQVPSLGTQAPWNSSTLELEGTQRSQDAQTQPMGAHSC